MRESSARNGARNYRALAGGPRPTFWWLPHTKLRFFREKRETRKFAFRHFGYNLWGNATSRGRFFLRRRRLSGREFQPKPGSEIWGPRIANRGRRLGPRQASRAQRSANFGPTGGFTILPDGIWTSGKVAGGHTTSRRRVFRRRHWPSSREVQTKTGREFRGPKLAGRCRGLQGICSQFSRFRTGPRIFDSSEKSEIRIPGFRRQIERWDPLTPSQTRFIPSFRTVCGVKTKCGPNAKKGPAACCGGPTNSCQAVFRVKV